MLHSTLLFFHLLGFAGAIGGGATQQSLFKRSQNPDLAPSVREHLEQTAFWVLKKIELPSMFVSFLSGLTMLLLHGVYLRAGWMHAKITLVFLLLVLDHVEMFNAKAIVAARTSNQPEELIVARKKRHERFGRIGALLLLSILILVTYRPF